MLRGVSMIVAATSSLALVDLATVKDELGIAGTADDAFLRRAIDQASRAISGYVNRVFQSQTYEDLFWEEYHRGRRHSPVLQLAQWPILQIVSLTVCDVALTADEDYLLDAATGRLIRIGSSSRPIHWEHGPITCQYKAGYAGIPDDVADAALRLVKSRFFARDRDPGLRSENAEGIYQAEYWFGQGPGASGDLTPDVVAILDRYRIPVVA